MSNSTWDPSWLIMPLYEAAQMIRGMGELIENERPEHWEMTDAEVEAQKGKGRILKMLARRVRGFGEALDEYDVRKEKKHER